LVDLYEFNIHNKKMSKRFLQNIGKNIKNLRKDKKLSQEKFGELIGLSRNSIGTIERAEANIHVLTLYKIANALEVEPYELLKFDQ
jgi:transcriptional regulator with XRE-family HTH domain